MCPSSRGCKFWTILVWCVRNEPQSPSSSSSSVHKFFPCFLRFRAICNIVVVVVGFGARARRSVGRELHAYYGRALRVCGRPTVRTHARRQKLSAASVFRSQQTSRRHNTIRVRRRRLFAVRVLVTMKKWKNKRNNMPTRRIILCNMAAAIERALVVVIVKILTLLFFHRTRIPRFKVCLIIYYYCYNIPVTTTTYNHITSMYRAQRSEKLQFRSDIIRDEQFFRNICII